ncbi:MAG: hypothetical protein DHS20C08_12880 [Rhodomicrobium sp.]|nr:MAG: hypothetical protein DHS20C08_12880 [Rhodomicrobium sp.]
MTKSALVNVTKSALAKLIYFTTLLSLLSACSASQGPSLVGKANEEASEAGGMQQVTLSPAQTEVYQTGIKGLITSSETADFVSVKTLKFSSQPGLHICGYASYQLSGAKKETPFYVEIREEEGKPTLHRGQLGSDAAKLSKVKFVCRHHGLF